MKIPVYNLEGKIVEKMEASSDIFGVALKPDVVKQVVMVWMANKRAPISHTKGRAEKRGGGKKPWRQKGTGRARHGSIRSPLWIGGGVTFGPTKERNWKKKINKKVKQLALRMVLSDRAQQKRLIVVDTLGLPEIKTKKLISVLEKLPSGKKSTLILLPEKDERIQKSAANLSFVSIVPAKDIHAGSLLGSEYVVLSKEALAVITGRLLKQAV